MPAWIWKKNLATQFYVYLVKEIRWLFSYLRSNIWDILNFIRNSSQASPSRWIIYFEALPSVIEIHVDFTSGNNLILK